MGFSTYCVFFIVVVFFKDLSVILFPTFSSCSGKWPQHFIWFILKFKLMWRNLCQCSKCEESILAARRGGKWLHTMINAQGVRHSPNRINVAVVLHYIYCLHLQNYLFFQLCTCLQLRFMRSICDIGLL